MFSRCERGCCLEWVSLRYVMDSFKFVDACNGVEAFQILDQGSVNLAVFSRCFLQYALRFLVTFAQMWQPNNVSRFPL